MSQERSIPLDQWNEDAALRSILQGTATETGERFFYALVQQLASALGTHGAWVTEYIPQKRRLRGLAFLMDGQWVENYEFDIAGTPCEQVIDSARLVHFPDRLIDLFPHDQSIRDAGFISYLGVPLLDVDAKVLGHMAVVDRRPIPEQSRVLALFQIFAARAAAELQRMRAESEVRQREEKLARLVDGAMDSIIELNEQLEITRVNSAFENVFRGAAEQVIGKRFASLLDEESGARLARLRDELKSRRAGQPYLWIRGGLQARRMDGEPFTAEATLSQFAVGTQTYYSLILRNVDDRLEAEQKIRRLSEETEYLKEELREFRSGDEVIGQSQALRAVLRDVEQVAPTDASVLILGETGTGKELIARAIHRLSPRHQRPLVKVNCAAMATHLMESEFFGHEKGAFTGATDRRQGRFALADGGTIFLDEVGELPLELQAKLLRVVQEGEFEPVGSSHTKKVDVRVVAATNRDLEQAIQEGTFRKDLYYRLHVFPITLPPLRQRGDDVLLLAASMAQRHSKKLGRDGVALTANCIRRLKAYDWPGNVRELENVIERAVITSRNGQLDLDRALPQVPDSTVADQPRMSVEDQRPILTVQQLQQQERENILRALECTSWRVAGDQGAAKLLGINASTLASRMKALGIQRPR